MARRLIGTTAAIFMAIAATGCPNLSVGLNEAPPNYVKSFTAYKEGSDGLMLYFILADKTGAMTTAAGAMDIEIVETSHEYSKYEQRVIERETLLFKDTYYVVRKDFQLAKIGTGAFEHEAIICPLGRLTYSKFRAVPSEHLGKIRATFRTIDERKLPAEETVFF